MCGEILPSKFLFPDNTETPYKFSFWIASTMLSGKGPELPIHVVQPYPTRLNPRLSKYVFSPAFSK